MSRNAYVLQHDKGAFCSVCGHTLDILCKAFPPVRSVMFYICWNCRRVIRIGFDEVKRVDEVEKSDNAGAS